MFTHLLPTRGFSAAAALAVASWLASPTAQAQTIDGTRDASYPAPLAVQANPTGFGDSNAGLIGGANGDELDNISAQIVGTNLLLFIGGNLQSNNNHVEIFFDSKSGGQNQLLTGGGGPLTSLTGLKFDAGFVADYLVSASVQGTTSATAPPTFTSLTVDYGVVGNASASSTAGMGTTAAASTALMFGTNAGAVAINNSNTAGVGPYVAGTPAPASGTVATNGTGTVTGAANVTTGLELLIPLAALGTTAGGGDIKICAFTNGASHDYVSNQALGSFPYGTGNLGDGTGGYTGGATPIAKVDFTAYAGNQYVTVANGGALATTTAQERTQISVAPNPAQGRIMVQLPATVADLHLTLYNGLGQAVRQVSPLAGTTNAAVEANGLASGVYLLRVQSGADILATQRVVLN